MATLTETLEQMKEQSKTKMIAAIEKMKELKAGYSTKLEEVDLANTRITELEEALSNANQEVSKYRGAMEKAMPKFKELKAELDAKTMEKNAACEENVALTQKLQELNERLQKNMDANNDLIDVSDSSDLGSSVPEVRQKSQGAESLTNTVDNFAGLTQTLLPIQANSVNNLLDVDFVNTNTKDESSITPQTHKEMKMKNADQDTIAKLTQLVVELRANKEEITANALLTESSLRSEIEALTQVD